MLSNRKRIIQFGSKIRKLLLFPEVGSEKHSSYSNRFSKKKTNHTTRISVKNYYIRESQSNRRTPVPHHFE